MTTYYVSNSGDDGADGLSSGTPWLTLSKVAGETFSAGDVICLRRGDVWRESIAFPSSGSPGVPIVVKPYGSGSDPVISASDTATGWVATGGQTIVYQISKALVANGVAMVWEDAVRLTSRASVALVEANPGSFYWDTGGNILYISATDQGNPETNGKVYEATGRTFCLKDNGKKYLRFEDLCLRHSWGSDSTYGNLEISGAHNLFLRGSSHGVRRHAVQILAGAVRSYVDYMDIYDAVASYAVSFFGRCSGCAVRRCTIRDSAGYVTMHGASGAATNMPLYASVYKCTMSNADSAADITLLKMFEFYSNQWCEIRGCTISGVALDNAVLFKEGRVYGFRFIANVLDVSQVQNISDPIFLSATPGVQFLHNLFTGNNSRRVIRAYNGSTGTVISGNVFYGCDEAIDIDAASQAGTRSDRNVFYSMVTRVGRWGASTYTTLTQWQSGSSQDANSLETNPLFTDYAGGNYIPATGSPLIELGNFGALGLDSRGRLYKTTPSAGPSEVFWERPSASRLDSGGRVAV